MVLIGDLNGDGQADLAGMSNSTCGGVSVLLNSGNGTFAAPVSVASPSWSSLALGDLNGDGKLDIAAPSGNGVGVFLNAR
jgi:hypothetical protein